MTFARTFLVAALAATAMPVGAQTPAPRTGPTAYLQAGAATAPVADAYLKAYIGLDWDRLETMLADDASFHDPTAARLFTGLAAQGKARMMTTFRTNYAGLKRMAFRSTRTIHSGDLALYQGDLDYTLDMGDGRDVTSVAPMVIVIEVRDGKVASHRDYVDYAPFIAAERASRPAKK